MGRPLNKKFFGNLNYPYQDQATGGPTGAGGASISTITVSNSGTLYSQGTTVAIGAPQIADGIPATISYSINSAGNIAVTELTSGTGYTSAPSLTVTKAGTTTKTVTGNYTATTLTATSVTGIFLGMVISGGQTGSNGRVQTITGPTAGVYTITTNVKNNGTFTNTVTFTDAGSGFASSVGLATETYPALAFTSYLTTGSSAVSDGDIMKQEASRRYLVDNSQGRGQCKLVTTDVLTPGTMKILATDFGGATYWVKKLTAHRATLVNRTSTSTALVKVESTGWTLGSATGTTVTIAHT